MPIINVKLVKGALDEQKQQDLLPRLTDAMESVYPGLRDVTYVTVEEVSAWGIGGNLVDAEKVAAHASNNLKGQ